MYKIYITLLLLPFIYSCVDFDQNVIYGSGDIVDDYREPGTAIGLIVKVRSKVLITHGEKVNVKLTGDKNILPLVTTKMEGGNLVIDATENISFSKGLQVEIVMPEFNKLIVESDSQVLVKEGAYGQNLEIVTNNGGSVEMEETWFMFITAVMNGSGLIKLEGDCNGFTGIINGSGSIEAKGRCEKLNITTSSSGEVRMSDMVSTFCTLMSSGSGNCRVRVLDSITAIIKGTGNIYLYGDIDSININLTDDGAGALLKIVS